MCLSAVNYGYKSIFARDVGWHQNVKGGFSEVKVNLSMKELQAFMA